MTKRQLEKILSNNEWDFGNSILYKLCSGSPFHKNSNEIIAKILFIGRIYAASIERGRNKEIVKSGDDFYINHVAPCLKYSILDEKLVNLMNYRRIDGNNFVAILKTHKYLLNLFCKLTGLEKRSLASKYLHFHKPNLFFIYDSRVAAVIRKYKPITMNTFDQLNEIKNTGEDFEYSKFVIKSLEVRNRLEEILERKITPREYDKILIYHANNHLEMKF